MENVLEDYKKYTGFNEVYEVVKTAELVGYDRNMYRIEVLKCFSNPNVPYLIRSLIWRHITVQPTYPKTSGKFDRQPEDMGVWVDVELPWVVAQTADGALAQALSFLAGRTRHGTKLD